MKLSELWLKDVLGVLPEESKIASDEELRGLYGDNYTTFTNSSGSEMVKVACRGELDPDINFVFSRRMPVKDGKIIDLTKVRIEYPTIHVGNGDELTMWIISGMYDAAKNELWITYLNPTHTLITITTKREDGTERVPSRYHAIGDDPIFTAQHTISSDKKTEAYHFLVAE